MFRAALTPTIRQFPQFSRCMCSQRRLRLGAMLNTCRPAQRTLGTQATTRPLDEMLKTTEEKDEAEISRLVTEWLKAKYSAPIDIPGGWSNEWDKYDHLFTLFWPSPYPLHLRQMEMAITIQHRIKGEIVPLLYATLPTAQFGKNAFLFEIRGGEDVYIYDVENRTLFKFDVEDREDALMHLLVLHDARLSDSKSPELPLTSLPPDPEGSSILHRILNNDETVKDALAKGEYLPYVPQ